jgi:hypothetical protein
VAQRDLLVEGSGFEAARTKRGQDDVRVAQPGGAVGGRRDAQIEAAGTGHPLGDPAHDVEPSLVEVHEGHFGAFERGAAKDQGGHGARCARAPAADVGELDPGHRLAVFVCPLGYRGSDPTRGVPV